MYHSGDDYEVRARALRHRELRRLAGALFGFFSRIAKPGPDPATRPADLGCANDRPDRTDRPDRNDRAA